MRTYSLADTIRARKEWADFGPEWHEVRRVSQGWTIFPPVGSKHDDRDAAKPSQRAIVYRALVDNPGELRKILLRVRSWNGVVASIIGLETRLRADADDLERDVRFDKARDPDHREAAMSLKRIVERITAS